MRSEQEMRDLIINTAREDERVRAVIMNGSRTNPNAPVDIFQDFDIARVDPALMVGNSPVDIQAEDGCDLRWFYAQ